MQNSFTNCPRDNKKISQSNRGSIPTNTIPDIKTYVNISYLTLSMAVMKFACGKFHHSRSKS